MSKMGILRAGYVLLFVTTVGGTALPQAGCLGNSKDSEESLDGETLDEVAATENAQVVGGENVAEPSITATTWTAEFISVMKPPGITETKVLDIQGASLSDGAKVLLYHATHGPNQRWQVTLANATLKAYELKVAHSGKCLDMAVDGTVGNGTRVQQWACNRELQQQWIPSGTSGWVSLRNAKNQNLCLDVKGGVWADSALLEVYTCHGSWNQRWNIFP